MRIIFCLFFSTIYVFASDLPKYWRLSQDIEGVQVWRLKSDNYIATTYEGRSNEAPIDFSEFKRNNFTKKYEKDKRKILSLIGIHNWTVTKYKWSEQKDGLNLIIKGSYTDHTQETVLFKEFHYFKKLRTYQVLQTFPRNDPKVAEQLDIMLKYLKGRAKF